MQITQRRIAEVVVLDLNGSLTEFEHGTQMREIVTDALSSGVRRFLLNLEHTRYVNSTGLGEIVRLYTLIYRSGGLMWLCHPTKRIVDLFMITKLLTVFDRFDTVEHALTALEKTGFETSCPRCGPETWLRFDEAIEFQICHACETRFNVQMVFPSQAHQRTNQVTALRIPTYANEGVLVVPGAPTVITVDGRLDLFASESLDEAVRLVSTPRHIVFRLPASDITSQGLEALARLCGRQADGSRGAISSARMDAEGRKSLELPPTSMAYESDEAATAALGEPSVKSTVTVVARMSRSFAR